jgi:hypothetical protein
VPKYCQTTITRNCFCRLQDEFISFSPCVQNGCSVASWQAVNMTKKYFQDTCIRQQSGDGSGYPVSSSDQSTADQVVNSPSDSSSSTSDGPVSRLSLIIGLASGFGSLIAFCLSIWFYLRKRVSLHLNAATHLLIICHTVCETALKRTPSRNTQYSGSTTTLPTVIQV